MKAGASPFYVQKVHLEVGGLLSAVAMLFISGVLSKRPNDAFWKKRDIGGGRMESGIFVAWDAKIVLVLVAQVVQSWLGGLVAKRLSTVVRAVAQCLSLLLIYFVGDLVLKHVAFDWPVGSMALAVALTVQVFSLAGKPRASPDTGVSMDEDGPGGVAAGEGGSGASGTSAAGTGSCVAGDVGGPRDPGIGASQARCLWGSNSGATPSGAEAARASTGSSW